MKHSRLRMLLCWGLLASAGTLGAVGCLPDAPKLGTGYIIAASLVLTLCFSRPKGGWVFLIGTALLLRFDKTWLGGWLLCGCLTWTLARRKGSVPALLLLAVPLIYCGVQGIAPAPLPLGTLLGTMLLLLLTDSIRRESSLQSTRLLLSSLLPVAALVGAVLLLFPQSSYVNRSDRLLRSLSARLPGVFQTLPLPAMESPASVDLDQLRGQPETGEALLEITDSAGGTIYLRSRDYSEYTGTQWLSSPERQETFDGMGAPLGTTSIRTASPMPQLLLPYYPQGGTLLTGGQLENTGQQTEYTMTRFASAACPFPEDRYLALPEATAAGAKAILRTLPTSTVQAIAEYVRRSAGYDRLTGAMPMDAEDFALWFLEESDRGYCVHFATTAAVLLRAAGIPARYVTGFVVQAQPGETIAVTADDAHAWTEYFSYADSRWHLLDIAPEKAPPIIREPLISPKATQKFSLFLIFSAVFAIWAQRKIRLFLRWLRRRRGSTNQRALALWQEVRLLGALSGTLLPEALLHLAEKARFSQHSITPEELAAFFRFREDCLRKIQKKPLAFRAICMYYYGVL